MKKATDLISKFLSVWNRISRFEQDYLMLRGLSKRTSPYLFQETTSPVFLPKHLIEIIGINRVLCSSISGIPKFFLLTCLKIAKFIQDFIV